MKKQEYAVVDIETTGGNARYSRITEIAIIIFDGEEVIDRWETLINPEKNIPLPIFALTGIDNEMVRDAPIFDDVAKKIFEMLTMLILTTLLFVINWKKAVLNGQHVNYVLFVPQEKLNRAYNLTVSEIYVAH